MSNTIFVGVVAAATALVASIGTPTANGQSSEEDPQSSHRGIFADDKAKRPIKPARYSPAALISPSLGATPRRRAWGIW